VPSRILVFTCLTAALAGPALAQNPAVTVTVNAATERRAIDPRIYGLNYATTAQLIDLRVTLNRSGGNNTTRYNWQQNADNRGSDWYFESVPLGPATAGESADTFFSETRAGGAEPMLTIPMVGWVGRLAANRDKLASFSIAKYGAQQDADWQWFPDAGNGVRTNGQFVTGNDPNDASVPSDVDFQAGWMQHLVNKWGAASGTGLKYYILDNEPAIWHATHRDVHPVGQTMDELRDKIVAYGARVKQTDPSAQVVAPEEFGWSGYLFSGYDLQWGSINGWNNLPDRAAHGGADHLPWLLDQLRQEAAASGRRVLDVFTVHYYPQGGEFGNDTSTSMQLRRNRSTRSLWDPSYVDETWVADEVRLLPRLREWIAAYYPGTKIGITEYSWGAEGHINGATAQADVLGIFGREGLDLATRWTTPATSSPTYKAIKMFRNHDGTGKSFGDVSVSTQVPNPDQLAAFSALRSSDGALTLMVVSKALSGNTPLTVSLAGFAPAGPAQAWQLTSANAITALADVPVSSGGFNTSVPPQSITLFVMPGATSEASLSVSDASVTEGQSGTRILTFTVTLTPAGSVSAPAARSVVSPVVEPMRIPGDPRPHLRPRVPPPPPSR
jgi:hypothetical protein